MTIIHNKTIIGVPVKTAAVMAIALIASVIAPGCTHHVTVDPIKVEPIDITLHIYLKADEKLDSFFDYQNELPSATVPNAAESVAVDEPDQPITSTEPTGGAL